MDARSLSSQPDLARDETRKLILDLRGEVQALERRVSALEHHAPVIAAHPEALPIPGLAVSADTVPALGRALLAIAGAYLLRALTEMGILPRPEGIAAGIVYAAFWLWLASRARREFTAALHASTAILILVPLLWESAARLNAMPLPVAAATLLVLPIAAYRLKPGSIILSIAAPACAWTALILILGTRSLLPFTLAVLAIAALSEFAQINTRWIVAIAADCAVLLLAGLAGRRGGLPEGYAPVPIFAATILCVLLAAIYSASALARTLVRFQPFSVFGIAQTVLAFVFGIGGVWYLTHATLVIAFILAASAAGCEWIAASIANRRNLYAYAIFAFLLSAAAVRMIASGWALSAIWLALAILLFWINPGKLGGWNATGFLWLAAAFAPHAIIVAPAAAIVYAVSVRSRAGLWPASLIAAALFYPIAASLLTQVSIPGLPAPSLVGCALALAALGARFGRRELVWLMYAAMAAAAWQMLARDLASPDHLPLVISLLVFGAALVLLPRILKSVGHQPQNLRR